MEPASTLPQNKNLLAKLIGAIDPKAVAFDLLIGWLVWVTIIVVKILQNSDSLPLGYALLDLDGHWQSAFLWSLPVVLVVSLIHHLRLNRPWHAAVTTCILYIGPMAIGHIGLMLLATQFHGYAQAHDTRQTLGLITIVFYLVGIGYLAVKARQNDDQAIAALLIPPYVVVILTVALSVFQIITSTDYRYRNAFQLTVERFETRDGQVHIEGSLHVTKPGTYAFAAISNRPFEIEEDPSLAPAILTWKTGQPAAEGDYTFEIRCKDSETNHDAPPNPAEGDTATYTQFPEDVYEPWGYLQISVLTNKDPKSAKTLKAIPINTWEGMDFPTSGR